jgi:NADH dehydrogenase FAD-containing subunit
LERLKQKSSEFNMNTDVVGATPSSVKPRDGTTIPYYTIIWASGVTPSKLKVHGFLAWWLWRTYYLANLPTMKKKLKVLSDWMMDLIYKPDVAMIKKFIKDEELGKKEELRQEEREAQEFNETDRAKNRGVSSGKNLQAT